MESRHFGRQTHLPRHRCQDTRRGKMFGIRLRQDETETSFKGRDMIHCKTQVARH